MDLKFPCPTCGTELTVDETAAGQSFACVPRKCGGTGLANPPHQWPATIIFGRPTAASLLADPLLLRHRLPPAENQQHHRHQAAAVEVLLPHPVAVRSSAFSRRRGAGTGRCGDG